MELVGHCKDVRVGKLHGIGEVLLDTGAGIENQFNPGVSSTLVFDVVFEGPSDLAFSEVGALNELIGE